MNFFFFFFLGKLTIPCHYLPTISGTTLCDYLELRMGFQKYVSLTSLTRNMRAGEKRSSILKGALVSEESSVLP